MPLTAARALLQPTPSTVVPKKGTKINFLIYLQEWILLLIIIHVERYKKWRNFYKQLKEVFLRQKTSKEWAITHNDYRTTTIHIRPIIDTCDNT
jgi:hypothetical protein